MAVRSRVLGAVNGITAGTEHTLVLVPAGRTAIVRFWSVQNGGSTARSMRVRVRSAGIGATIAYDSALAGGAFLRSHGDGLVLNPGDSLTVTPGTEAANSTTSAIATGSLLEGEPE